MPLRMTVSTSPRLSEVLPLRRGLAAELPGIAADLAGDIRRRTASGRDVSGKPFRPKRDGSRSTLQDSGRMVRSLRPVQVTDRGFVLAPVGKRNQRIGALAHQRGRRWVGASDRQIDEARERIADAAIPKDR